ncbi:hypothetical protein H9Y04_38945 [Streptomyces sp. TRM66268-LWL]|uniref:Uncharacterized protein n=1 Tax=Streptomyces polyasparticus TaxID=2767826 RepID=A0ABR7SSP4_9ACTN|nr:hypothetical protein [Streptomyces polyasparticus]MBC9718520.1 hypothetical protein [Streptomyces polyasparticus]
MSVPTAPPRIPSPAACRTSRLLAPGAIRLQARGPIVPQASRPIRL